MHICHEKTVYGSYLFYIKIDLYFLKMYVFIYLKIIVTHA